MNRILRTKIVFWGALLDVVSRMFKIEVRIWIASASWASSAMERKGEERKQALGQLCLPSGISIEQLGHSAFRQFTSFVQRAIIRVNWKEKKKFIPTGPWVASLACFQSPRFLRPPVQGICPGVIPWVQFSFHSTARGGRQASGSHRILILLPQIQRCLSNNLSAFPMWG